MLRIKWALNTQATAALPSLTSALHCWLLLWKIKVFVGVGVVVASWAVVVTARASAPAVVGVRVAAATTATVWAATAVSDGARVFELRVGDAAVVAAVSCVASRADAISCTRRSGA